MFKNFRKFRKICNLLHQGRLQSTSQPCGPSRPEIAELKIETCEECSHRIMDLMDIRCKSALIMGGLGGIGLETAKALIKAGAMHVTIADKEKDKSEEAMNQLSELVYKPSIKPTIKFIHCDIRKPKSVEFAFQEAKAARRHIDILINSVAIFNETPEFWEKTIEVNLQGLVTCMTAAMKYMARPLDCPDGTCIVNIASMAYVTPYISMPIYTASQFGVLGLTNCFGHDYHHNQTKIRCIAICPGNTETELLRNVGHKHYTSEWGEYSKSMFGCPQSPSDVSKAILHAIQYGPNGSNFLINNGKFYRYDIPDYRQSLQQEAILY